LELSSDDAVADEDVQDADDAETVASDDTTSFEPTGSLSAEEEADLQQELAEVEADEEQTAEDAPSGRRILPDNDDAALTRIMGQADEQLSEPEGNRRRNAIAQLKAAVAATEAARQLGDNADDKRTQENAFREDFKEVVRPTPASAVPRTEVTKEKPLHLRRFCHVALQRQRLRKQLTRATLPSLPKKWVQPSCRIFWKLRQPTLPMWKASKTSRVRRSSKRYKRQPNSHLAVKTGYALSEHCCAKAGSAKSAMVKPDQKAG